MTDYFWAGNLSPVLKVKRAGEQILLFTRRGNTIRRAQARAVEGGGFTLSPEAAYRYADDIYYIDEQRCFEVSGGKIR